MLVFDCNVLVIHSLGEIILALFYCCFDLQSSWDCGWKQSKNRAIACLYLLVEAYVVVGVGDRVNSAIMYVYMLY